MKPNSHKDSDHKSFPLTAKIINGGVAGIVGVASVFPIDLAKTRLQNQRVGQEAYSSMLDCLKKVIRNDGLIGMYRGSAVNLLLITPEKAIKLTCNDWFRHLLSAKQKGDTKLTLFREMLAGGGAGLCQIVVTTPMELLKIQGQDAGRTNSSLITKTSATQVAINLVKENGFRGLFKGISATLLRDVTFSAIYFPLFAHLRSLKECSKDKEQSVLWVNFVSGCLAATVASVAVNPADVVKTRLQSIKLAANEERYSGLMEAFSKIYRKEGPGAFIKGAGCRIMYIAPLFGIAQTVYYLGVGEKVVRFIKEL